MLSHSDLTGFEVQKQIARERPEMPIIVISGFGDVPTTVEAMKAGAVDFLVKPFCPEVLLGTISQSLERSRMSLDREMRIRDLRNCYASLTPREQQVMRLVVSGLLSKQVGWGTGNQRDHNKGTPWPGHAKGEGEFPRRPGEDGGQAPGVA